MHVHRAGTILVGTLVPTNQEPVAQHPFDDHPGLVTRHLEHGRARGVFFRQFRMLGAINRVPIFWGLGKATQ